MTFTLPKELIAALTGLGGATIGYAFREYRNRVRPFFQITEIDGTMSKRDDRTEITEETSDKLTDTFFIKEVDQHTDLGTLSDCNGSIARMAIWWPQDKLAVDQIFEAMDDDSLCAALAATLNWPSVDRWLTQFLVSDRITVKKLPENLVEQIPVHDDNDESNGQVWFLLPKKATNFGAGLKNRAVRAKCEPFIQAVRFLHHDTIKDVFRQFSQVVEKEYQIAIECRTEVKDKVNEKSRWCFYCYLANMSNSPVVIEKDGYVHVRDKTRVHYKEDCYLLLIRRDDKGARSLQDTNTPLVIKQGEDCEFAFITKSAQSGMELGKALREAFDRGQGKCHLTVVLRRVGLLKRQRYRSASSQFCEPAKMDGNEE